MNPEILFSWFSIERIIEIRAKIRTFAPMYQEYQPDIRLSSYIECYWTEDHFLKKEDTCKILPDGCVDIKFSLDGKLSSPLIIGTMTSIFNAVFTEKTRAFGIRFKPAGITAFTRAPVNELTDKLIELEIVDTLFDESVYNSLPEKESIEDVIHHIDNYLLNKLVFCFQPDKRILHAVDLLYQANGILSISSLASDVCIEKRHFERKFKRAVGICPKMFSKVIKFQNVLKKLKIHPHNTLYDIAFDCGYYDHTHLIKDFKKFSGETPAIFHH
jgi:AraC-like DNA-binding protein